MNSICIPLYPEELVSVWFPVETEVTVEKGKEGLKLFLSPSLSTLVHKLLV